MTKDDWRKAEERCSLFSSCELLCDGYTIDLKEGRMKNKIVIDIYVNGKFRGEWLDIELNKPESKFFPTKESFIYSKKRRQDWMKLAKKFKGSVITEAEVNKKIAFKSFYFSSFRQAKTHLIKVCDSIELIND